MKKQYYDPDSELNLQRSIDRAERKLKELQLRKQISDIARQIKELEDFRVVYPKNDQAVLPPSAA